MGLRLELLASLLCADYSFCPLSVCRVQIARLLLYREFWYGTADSTSRSGGGTKQLQLLPSHSFEVPVTQLTRPQPSDLAGTWNVFVIAATPAVEENPNTLQVGAVAYPCLGVFSSREG